MYPSCFHPSNSFWWVFFLTSSPQLPGRRLRLCLRLLCRFLVSFVSSPQGRPAAFQIQSDLRHGMCINYLLVYGPSLGFPLVLASRLLYEGKAFCWLTLESYNDGDLDIDRCSQHLALFPCSPCGWSTRIWPTVGWSPFQYGTPSFSAILLMWGLASSSPLWPHIRPVFPDSGRF